jgi:NAD(P)-dependent dehydrogenase (short-subunit alcohol dehydrogenase family)
MDFAIRNGVLIDGSGIQRFRGDVLLRSSIADGGVGFSTTIAASHSDYEGRPVPSRVATREEMVTLAGVVGEYPGTWLEMVFGVVAMQEQHYALGADMSRAAGRALNWNAIQINSNKPELVDDNLRAAYCTSKHALAGLTKAAALDYAAQNIRVNLVAPGPVDTRMFQQGAGATAEGRELVAASTPMRRICRPEEIAEAVVWIASPAASYLTGAVVPVDGGYTLP